MSSNNESFSYANAQNEGSEAPFYLNASGKLVPNYDFATVNIDTANINTANIVTSNITHENDFDVVGYVHASSDVISNYGTNNYSLNTTAVLSIANETDIQNNFNKTVRNDLTSTQTISGGLETKALLQATNIIDSDKTIVFNPQNIGVNYVDAAANFVNMGNGYLTVGMSSSSEPSQNYLSLNATKFAMSGNDLVNRLVIDPNLLPTNGINLDLTGRAKFSKGVDIPAFRMTGSNMIIEDSSGNNVFEVDSSGNVLTQGTIQNTVSSGAFVLKNSTGLNTLSLSSAGALTDVDSIDISASTTGAIHCKTLNATGGIGAATSISTPDFIQGDGTDSQHFKGDGLTTYKVTLLNEPTEANSACRYSQLLNTSENVHTFYVNSGSNTLQDVLPSVDNTGSYNQKIKLGAGSYSAISSISISDLKRVLITGDFCPVDETSVIFYDDISISGTSDRIKFCGIQFSGSISISNDAGRVFFDRCAFGSDVTFSGSVGNFCTFNDCSFVNGVTINNTFGGVAFFFRCNWNGVNPTLLQASPLQAEFADNVNFNSFPSSSVATLGGYNTLSVSGQLRVSAGEFFQNDSALTGLPPASNNQFVKYITDTWTAYTLQASDIPTLNANQIADNSITNTEYQFLAGLSSNAQNQLDGKLNLTGGNITGNLYIKDGSGNTKFSVLNSTGNTNVSGSLTVNGDLNILGSTTTNNSVITSYNYISIIQNPSDGTHPCLSISQGGTSSGSIVKVTDSDDSTIFEINQSCDINLNNKLSITSITGDLSTDGSISIGNLLSVTDVATFLAQIQLPIFTNSEISALTPASGEIVYSSSDNEIKYYNGSAWTSVGGSSFNPTITSPNTGDMLFYNGSEWVNGIFIAAPTASNSNIGNNTVKITSSALSSYLNLSAQYYDFEIYDNSGSSLIASSGDITANNWTYSSLTSGTSYKSRCRIKSNFSGVSPWSSLVSFSTSTDVIASILTGADLSAYNSASNGDVVLISSTGYFALQSSTSLTASTWGPIPDGGTAYSSYMNGTWASSSVMQNTYTGGTLVNPSGSQYTFAGHVRTSSDSNPSTAAFLIYACQNPNEVTTNYISLFLLPGGGNYLANTDYYFVKKGVNYTNVYTTCGEMTPQSWTGLPGNNNTTGLPVYRGSSSGSTYPQGSLSLSTTVPFSTWCCLSSNSIQWVV